MKLSAFLQSKDILQSINKNSPERLKEHLLERGRDWYHKNTDDEELIKNNLSGFGLSCDRELVEAVKTNIILHYYEKLLPLTGKPEFYADYLDRNVDGSDAVEKLKAVSRKQKGVLLATAHFGAIELIAPYLSRSGFPMNVLLKFTTEELSRKAHSHAFEMKKSGMFGKIGFVEIGKPETNAALEMASVLRKREVLLTVFDEANDYSIPVLFRNRKLSGGAGLHKIIEFAKDGAALFTIFMIRERDEKYRLVAKELQAVQGSIQTMYDCLSEVIDKHLDQWYFLHEKIPFMD